jgi:hypothetical protein
MMAAKVKFIQSWSRWSSAATTKQSNWKKRQESTCSSARNRQSLLFSRTA